MAGKQAPMYERAEDVRVVQVADSQIERKLHKCHASFVVAHVDSSVITHCFARNPGQAAGSRGLLQHKRVGRVNANDAEVVDEGHGVRQDHTLVNGGKQQHLSHESQTCAQGRWQPSTMHCWCESSVSPLSVAGAAAASASAGRRRQCTASMRASAASQNWAMGHNPVPTS